VKPIVGNKTIEVVEKFAFKESGLSFPVYSSVDEVSALTQSDLEMHLSQVYKALQKTVAATQTATPTLVASNALFERIQILSYLYSLAPSSEVRSSLLGALHFCNDLFSFIPFLAVFMLK
jgi:hypothetical protein